MMFSGALTAVVLLFLSWIWLAGAEPTPLALEASTDWFGYDGKWSAINLRVGSPQQWVSLFPNILGHETLVIDAATCVGDSANTCERKRGGVFNSNESSTWDELGIFAIGFQLDLADLGPARYGLDTISIGAETLVPEQIVGVLTTADFLLGSLGLGVLASNFTAEDDQPSFLATLVQNESLIPSHSFGYTAGAHHRLKGVPCSLTLGGVDLNRFVPNDVSFNLTDAREPVVAIDSISLSADPSSSADSVPDWDGDTLSLSDPSQAELFTIDSSTPFLWMPEAVCDSFADALNLSYDDSLQLYLYDESTGPTVLEDWNLNFTFTLADLPGSSTNVEISMGYEAFNQQLTFPFPGLNATASSPPVDYFPLRKASNSTQFTIGRVLLQEAYIAVDYGRNNFSISQAKFTNNAVGDVDLSPISRSPDSPFPGPDAGSDGGMSTVERIGIGIGVAVFLVIVLGVGVVLFFRKRRSGKWSSASADGEKSLLTRLLGPKSPDPSKSPTTFPDRSSPQIELPASNKQPTEVPNDASHCVVEAPNPPVEMPALPVPASYYEQDKNRYRGSLAELESNHAPGKGSTSSGPSVSPVSNSLPPYSPAQVGSVSISDPTPETSSFPRSESRFRDTRASEISDPISDLSPELPRRSSHRLRDRPISGHETSAGQPSPLTPSSPFEQRPFHAARSLLGSTDEDEEIPSRSVSRSSRFREEGINDQPLRPPPLRPRRSSWDDSG